MLYRITKGLDIRLAGAPRQIVSVGNLVGQVAVFANDYPGVTPDLVVNVGDRVALGDPLFRDRSAPEIRITAPVAGIVAKIESGARRQLSFIEIKRDGSATRSFEPPVAPGSADIAKIMHESGLWANLVQRPFGRVPRSDARPAAIFVKALESDPLSADASVVLARRDASFRAGVKALTLLTDGLVFVCQGPGPRIADEGHGVQIECFGGPHPAGLTGTHIDRLFPAGASGPIWQMHYQDVIALGTVLTTGRLPDSYVVALAGPGMREPRLVEAPLGAALGDLLHGEIDEGDMRVLSGSPLSGRETSHLRRGHWMVSVLRQPKPRREWPLPFAERWAAARPSAIIPTAALDRSLGPDLAVVPLIRALAVRDAETADHLGCRMLLEEDLALATYVTGGTTDFGALLRQVLDSLEAQS